MFAHVRLQLLDIDFDTILDIDAAYGWLTNNLAALEIVVNVILSLLLTCNCSYTCYVIVIIAEAEYK